MKLYDDIVEFVPFNQQERIDKDCMLYHLLNTADVFDRSNDSYHFTASSWITNYDRTKILMIHHNLYQSWAWTGGHSDGNKNLLEVAIKEAKEETGLRNIHVLSDKIFSLEILSVNTHRKNGVHIPKHLHFNITYLLEADDSEVLVHKKDENSAVAWFSKDDAVSASNEDWMRKNVYDKLDQKLSIWIKQEIKKECIR